MVRGSSYEWDPKKCLSLADLLIDFIRNAIISIGDESLLYKVHYSAAQRAIHLTTTHLNDIHYPSPDPFQRYGFMPAHLHAEMKARVNKV